MNKQSLEYSKSPKGTFGSFKDNFGNLASLNYLDILIDEDRLTMTTASNVFPLLRKYLNELYEIRVIVDYEIRKKVIRLIRDDTLLKINDTLIAENKSSDEGLIRSLLRNVVITYAKPKKAISKHC